MRAVTANDTVHGVIMRDVLLSEEEKGLGGG